MENERRLRTMAGTGSGFFVSESGHVLINHHVIDGCKRVHVAVPQGRAAARLVAADKGDDLAVLQTDISAPAVATLRSIEPALGEDVSVAGYPLRGLLSGMNMTSGSVSSASGLGGDARYLQITAPVQKGNSGGPLLDSSGAVVGIVVSKLDAMAVARATGDIPQNVNFAIKSAIARKFLSRNSIEFHETAESDSKGRVEIAVEAQRHTVLVECWK